MKPTRVEWADRAWNPISGCLKGCAYCTCIGRQSVFSGDIRANKGHKEKYRFDGNMYITSEVFESNGRVLTNPFGFLPTYHMQRLKLLETLKTPMSTIVSYDGEMFGPWVSDEYIREIFTATAEYPRQRFLYITSYPERYEKLEEKKMLPSGENQWFGWSHTSGKVEASPNIKGHKYLMIAPLLGEVSGIPEDVEWVILGRDQKKYKDQVTPKKEWVDRITAECREKKIPLFMESNIYEFASRIKTEYPQSFMIEAYSDKRLEMYMTKCGRCKKEGKKKEFSTVTISYGRKGNYRAGFFCKECLKEICREYDFGYIPEEEINNKTEK